MKPTTSSKPKQASAVKKPVVTSIEASKPRKTAGHVLIKTQAGLTARKYVVKKYRPEPTAEQMQQEMKAFAAQLHKDPDRAREFFKAAGILTGTGRFASPYK